MLDDKTPLKFEYAGASGGYIDVLGYPFCRGRIFETIEEDKNLKIKEEILWDRVAEALDELGEMNDVQFKVSPMTDEEILELNWDVFDENYQAMRNPEKEEKKDKRSAKQKRMDSPDRGINSPAFKEFMKQYGG